MAFEMIAVIDDIDECIKNINTAKDRSGNNNGNFKSEISHTDMPSIVAYHTCIENVKQLLKDYNALLEDDIMRVNTLSFNLLSMEERLIYLNYAIAPINVTPPV